MPRYLAKKLTYLVLTVLAVLATNFVIFHLMPGDPVTHIARGQHLDAAAIGRLRAYYGLDDPLGSQFMDYVGHLVHGELGYSYTYQAAVGPIVLKALGNTLILVTVSTLLVVGLGVIIGVFAGSRRGTRTDGAVVIGSLVFWSLPTFWVGMLLIFVFAVTLGWLPIAGMFTADALYPTVFTQLSDLGRHSGAADDRDGARRHRTVRIDHSKLAVGNAFRGLHDDREGQGPASPAGAVAARGSQRATPRGHGDHVVLQCRGGRHHSGGDGLLLAGHGTADLSVGGAARLSGHGGVFPDLRGRRRARELRE